jgi:hypothetical protein
VDAGISGLNAQYIKATYPFTFTMFAIAWGALTHGQGYDRAQQTAYLDGTLRWGFDWLMKVRWQIARGDVKAGC